MPRHHPAESFSASLKADAVRGHRFETRDEARSALFRYLETLAACRGDPAVERLADQVIALAFREEEGGRRLSERLRFQYVVHDDWHGRRSNLLQVLRLAVTPSTRDRAFVSLPKGWGFLYYLVRPFRIVHAIGWEKIARP